MILGSLRQLHEKMVRKGANSGSTRGSSILSLTMVVELFNKMTLFTILLAAGDAFNPLNGNSVEKKQQKINNTRMVESPIK